jgi:hypothetical protein
MSKGLPALSQLFTSLTNLDTDKLSKVAPALLSIGKGILALGTGSVLTSIGNLLGGGPVEMLQGIANTGDGIQKVATSLQSMAIALAGVSVALASIDVSKLEALDEFSSNQASNGIESSITSPIKAIGESAGGNKTINPSIDLTPMRTAINEVRDAVNKLYNKDTSINMDGKKVGTTLVQGSYKVA